MTLFKSENPQDKKQFSGDENTRKVGNLFPLKIGPRLSQRNLLQMRDFPVLSATTCRAKLTIFQRDSDPRLSLLVQCWVLIRDVDLMFHGPGSGEAQGNKVEAVSGKLEHGHPLFCELR